jgi:hypothetical protein
MPAAVLGVRSPDGTTERVREKETPVVSNVLGATHLALPTSRTAPSPTTLTTPAARLSRGLVTVDSELERAADSSA